jgi:RHS repeat-associated protein
MFYRTALKSLSLSFSSFRPAQRRQRGRKPPERPVLLRRLRAGCEMDVRGGCGYKAQRIFLLCALGACLFFAGFVGAQVAPGTPSWSAYDQHEVDTINLQSLSVILNVPVMSKAGAFPFKFSLTGADSYITTTGPGTLSVPLRGTDSSSILGRGVGLHWTSLVHGTCPGGQAKITYSGLSLSLADGTIHPLPVSDSVVSSTTCSTTLTDTTADGSGLTATVRGNASLPTITALYDNSGTSLSTSAVTDSNGNSISFSSSSSVYTDTLGLPVLTSSLTTSPVSYTWSDGSSTPPAVDVTNTGYTLRSAFGCANFADYDLSGQTLPTSISFPDSTSLGLTWEQTPGFSSDSTGRIATITLQEGGVITYNYNPSSGSNDGLNCTYLAPSKMTRVTADGTTSYAIAWQVSGGSCTTTTPCSTTTVVDPGGNKKVYYFSAGWNAAWPVTLALTEVQTFQNTGTVGSPTYSTTPTTQDFICYNTATYNTTPSNCAQASVSLPITSKWLYHEVGGSQPSLQETKFDKYGDVTYSAQYDFGAAALTFQTTVTYGSWNGSSCTAWTGNVRNKPCEVLMQDGSGNKLADRRMAYSSIGNLLSTSVFNGSTYIGQSNNNTYNANGTPLTTYDLANNETTYAYLATGYSDCGSGGCSSLNLAFPTTITNVGTELSMQATWDAIGGVKLTDLDPNGSKTAYSYDGNCGTTPDPFWRVGCVTDPLGYAEGISFLDSSNEVQTFFNFNGSAINTTSTVDSYGRSIDFQKETGPSTGSYDTMSAAYSWPSAYFQIVNSMPCNTTSLGSGCGITHEVTTLYDILNRPTTITESGSNGLTTNTYYTPANSATKIDIRSSRGPAPTWDGENTKQVQYEYDGLGRLTISCGILSSGGSSCGEANTASGIKTAYTYTTTTGSYGVQAVRGTQTKTNYTDSLGRVTQKTTPDTGTWNYYYDSVSTPSCPTGYKGSVGKLEAVKDPNGNLICYAYDALGRVTGINANGTTCRHFYYDTTYGAVPSGVTTPTYTLGRLAEASTDNCSGALITDEWFSYDKDGRKPDIWESTPNSGRYFHSSATFAGNGAVLTVNMANPSIYTNTYSLDGEGRWTSMVNSQASQTEVSSVVYNAASQPTAINLGSGSDNDAYTYDSNTGRMTQWVFTVGSANETGGLSWNPIGSLKTLTIVDGFHPGGTQTCNMGSSTSMGYDDLNRLLMYDCGSGGWGQTFSYDQYDNLTKAVISGRSGTTFNPGYNTLSGCSPCNNHYASGYGASYDSNGNQLYDPSNLNTYTWNEFSKLASIDKSGTQCATSGTCVVYDAFGREVEVDTGSTYTEAWYTQAGVAYMHGTTKVTGLWPAPGGGTMDDSTQYMHKDWLGSVRLVSTISNSTTQLDQAFTPYGEIYDTFGVATMGNVFTGDVQAVSSGTSGLWDTTNRELGMVSRWLSPDPAQAGWNPYAYVTNPNTFSDPSGLCQNHSSKIGSINCYNNPPGNPYAPDDSANDYSEVGSLGNQTEGEMDAEAFGTVVADNGQILSIADTMIDPASWGYHSPNGTSLLSGFWGETYLYIPGSEGASWTMISGAQYIHILNSFQPVMPVWGPNNLAKAGCTGPGIPCRVSSTPHAPPPGYPGATSYLYTIWDVNGTVVSNVTSVSEYFSNMISVGTPPNAGTWYDDGSPLDYGNVANGQFIDNLQGSYTAHQAFSAVVGGVPYAISTTSSMNGSTGSSTLTNGYYGNPSP